MPSKIPKNFAKGLQFKITKDPGKYLGVNLGKVNNKNDFFQSIIDKFHDRLTHWKGKTLSKGGRLTLAKSTLANIPIYTMVCFQAPKNVSDRIDKIVKNFWWVHEENERKLHMRSWDPLCLTKEEGGLGLKRIEDVNKALLAKQAWKIIKRPEEQPANIFLGNYCQTKKILQCEG